MKWEEEEIYGVMPSNIMLPNQNIGLLVAQGLMLQNWHCVLEDWNTFITIKLLVVVVTMTMMIQRMWNAKRTVISVITGKTGTNAK
jgi:hypothetical protein